MGYSNLHYDEYMENIDYWQGDLQIELPKWATELSEKGFNSVSALDFYNDIFGEDLEPARMPEDYRTGEYGAIAVERVPCLRKNKITGEMVESFKGRRFTITQGNQELFELIDKSENFCIISPISYAGLQRTNKNARYMYAMVIEIDDIVGPVGIKELIYSWTRTNLRMPQPTYIVCSGSGLHLYFVFERPIPMYANIFKQLSEIKNHFTRAFWNPYVTKLHQSEKVQYESINQPFRCVGTITKNRRTYAMAFETGPKVTIEYLNNLLPDDLKMDVIYKSNLSLAEAKVQYPKWYQRKIVEKKERGHWNRHKGIYFNWIEKMKKQTVVGHRYLCLENLCSLAVQCQIEPTQVEKDCRELAMYLETLTNDDSNHFTEYDVISALKTYHEADERAYRRRIDFISHKTGIQLTPNKRNGQTQKEHLEEARAIRDIRIKRKGKINWWEGNGRPVGSGTAEQKVLEWQQQHPSGSKSECHRDTGLSYPTIRRWWK